MNTRSSQSSFTEEMKAAIDASICKHMQTFRGSIDALTSEISELKRSLHSKENIIAQLEQRIAQLEARPDNENLQERIDQLEADHDSLEQYGRRLNIRVENVPALPDETPAALEHKVLGLLSAAGAAVQPNDVLRLHRSTALRTPTNAASAIKTSQVIVRLNNWRARESAHQARNTARANGNPIKQDLTKARRELITEAHAAMREWPTAAADPVYAYANINCQVVLRRGRDVQRIHCHADLERALRHFRPQ